MPSENSDDKHFFKSDPSAIMQLLIFNLTFLDD